jgi:hypothetical protein
MHLSGSCTFPGRYFICAATEELVAPDGFEPPTKGL